MCTDNKFKASSRFEPGTIWPTSSRKRYKRCSKLFHSNGIPNGEMSLVMHEYKLNLNKKLKYGNLELSFKNASNWHRDIDK